MSKKKITAIVSVVLVFVILAVSAIVYTRPSAWIKNPDKEIAFITLEEFTEYKKVNVSSPEKINELITEIKKTRTKKRIFINEHERADRSDSGFLITINYTDGTSENVGYSFIHNGITKNVCYYSHNNSHDELVSYYSYNVSFHNKELCNMILKNLNMNYDIDGLYDCFDEKYGE